MEIHDDGKRNPMVTVTEDEVLAWLRTKADEAGYADRQMVWVISQNADRGTECGFVIMVSNIKGSRK